MSESPTPEPGPLSVDQAVASLLQPAEPVEDNAALEAPQEAAEEPNEPQGESSSPEDTEDGAETPAEGEEGEAAPEPEKLAAPLYWKPEAKAVFEAMTPEQQAVVLAQEGPREEATAKAKADAAAKVQAADAELSKVSELASALTDRLPKWIETFTSKWGPNTPDWVALAQEHGTDAVMTAKLQYEAEQQGLRDAAAKTAEAQQLAHHAFLKAEAARLAELAPDLVAAPEKRAEVGTYLQKQGIATERLNNISATELIIARKAMLYDQGQAALKVQQAAPKAKPAATPQKAQVRPGAASTQSSPTSIAKQVTGRFYAKPTVDNAVALLLASKG